MIDYPRRWSLFFDNLVESVALGPSAVDLYLRILLAVDGEVVDRDIAHTDQVCWSCLQVSAVSALQFNIVLMLIIARAASLKKSVVSVSFSYRA